MAGRCSRRRARVPPPGLLGAFIRRKYGREDGHQRLCDCRGTGCGDGECGGLPLRGSRQAVDVSRCLCTFSGVGELCKGAPYICHHPHIGCHLGGQVLQHISRRRSRGNEARHRGGEGGGGGGGIRRGRLLCLPGLPGRATAHLQRLLHFCRLGLSSSSFLGCGGVALQKAPRCRRLPSITARSLTLRRRLCRRLRGPFQAQEGTCSGQQSCCLLV
mmetsp:Transcript_19537/g.59072  ORF Transcript_19537/g.59072 Transcript_19537/m.59072 type:complete len:216 (+) Transcript_19537:774-1421(+)